MRSNNVRGLLAAHFVSWFDKPSRRKPATGFTTTKATVN
jgi:hypothetical protein